MRSPVRLSRTAYEDSIKDAARRIKTRLLRENGGRLPRSAAGWKRLCLNCHLEPIALSDSEQFRARLMVTEQGAFVFYNQCASPRQQARWLAHELAEFLSLDDWPELFDGLSRTPFIIANYDGGDPFNFRHQVSQRLERLCFRK